VVEACFTCYLKHFCPVRKALKKENIFIANCRYYFPSALDLKPCTLKKLLRKLREIRDEIKNQIAQQEKNSCDTSTRRGVGAISDEGGIS